MTSTSTSTSNICDGCGETIDDLDAGFSPAVQGMRHGCGGTWRRPSPAVPADADGIPLHLPEADPLTID